MDLLCFWLHTASLAQVLHQPCSYTSVQTASGSRSCRSCAERNGVLHRAWCLLWHIFPLLPGCCWMLLHAHSFALGVRHAELLVLFDRNCPAHKIWNTGDILVSSHALETNTCCSRKIRGSCEYLAVILCWEMEEQKMVKILCISSDIGTRENGSWMKREGKCCRHRKGNFSGRMFLTFFLIHVDLILSYHVYSLHTQCHSSDLKEAQGLNLTRKLLFKFFIPNTQKLCKHTLTMIRHLKAPITWVRGVEKLDFCIVPA